MKKSAHNHEKISAAHPMTVADNKPKYEPPVVMSLGEFARGWGHIHGGHGQCTRGSNAMGQCGGGMMAMGMMGS
ncbi:MAG: hypothetical protein GY801_34180 [bacterium]|nr:hypothetical protein [bacterium]